MASSSSSSSSSSSTVSSSYPNKPHVMCIPFPLQGHINPMLKLANTLYSLGFHITFVNTEIIHNHLLNAGALKSFANLPHFRFETFPGSLPPPPIAAAKQEYYYCLLSQFAREKFLPPLHNFITTLENIKTVSCVISDGLMAFSIRIAREVGVPGFLLWVPNACSFMAYFKQNGLIPPRDGQLDMIVDSIGRLKKDHQRDDIPDIQTSKYDFPVREAEEAFQASGIIFNTFEALDQYVFDAIKSMFSQVYVVGPLQILLSSAPTDTAYHLNPVEEVSPCLKWLDSMKPNSVVYISFGDLVVMTPQQFTEFAWGICNSNHPFLWIIRPDFFKGLSTKLPTEFLKMTDQKRGLITTWCPHEQVLSHPSVGGFVTHFGDNSVLDSICAGVPMIGWPCYGDHQVTDVRCSCNQWGNGVEINKDMKREEVEMLVRDLMEGDKGKEMTRNAMQWKKLAVEATSQGGSSAINFDNLVKALSASMGTNERKEINMEVVVTSRETIKPSHPTPQHLRHLPLSFFDRIMYRVFVPMIFFYSKGSEKGDTIKATNLETSNHLKTSLAEALVKFYPLAGRVKEYHTECNDQGVPYFEAQAKCQLSQVVGQSCLAKLNKLLPYADQAGDLPMAILVNFFECGGIAVGTCMSHKLFDASSQSSFMNYWANVARGDNRSNTNLICPRFEFAKLFPPVEKQISYSTTNCSSSVARRFVFSASAISAMKSKYPMQTSRAEVLSAFIWTRFLAAAKEKGSSPQEMRWIAYHMVDLRTRKDPPLSGYHFGNLVGFARVGSSMDAGMEDRYEFIKRTRNAIRSVDDKFVRSLQKPEFADQYLETNKEEHESGLNFSSLSKFPFYEADFGWGRPIWVTMSGLYIVNSLVFMPTRSGDDGIEALLYLKEDDMAKLEADKEFLHFVSPPSRFKNQFLSSL